MTAIATNVLDTLRERGFLNQVSDEAGLRRATDAGPITLYCGFDVTSDSLHIGNLVQLMLLSHFQRHGHRVIALAGGGTTMVGDPTGRSTDRPLLTMAQIAANSATIQAQMAHYLDFTASRAIMRDNADWLPTLNYIAFLREIGRYFSVNEMLHMDTYKTRLESGLSFLEFNYLLLQSYDFLHLYRTERCVLQVGGGDQWSNCLGGMDLIRKADGGEAFVLTAPLITDASGQKMGKSTGNGISLNAAAMSPYDYYQFWINVEDAKVAEFLGLFTYLPMDEVRRLAALQGADIRAAKERLAWEATILTHGEAEAEGARDAARALFPGKSGGADAMGDADVPTITIPTVDFDAGLSLADIFVRAGLATSRGDARRKATQGGMYFGPLGERIGDMDLAILPADFPADGLLLRAGKKRYMRVVVE